MKFFGIFFFQEKKIKALHIVKHLSFPATLKILVWIYWNSQGEWNSKFLNFRKTKSLLGMQEFEKLLTGNFSSISSRIPWVSNWMVFISGIQQFSVFLETFPEIFGIIGWMESAPKSNLYRLYLSVHKLSCDSDMHPCTLGSILLYSYDTETQYRDLGSQIEVRYDKFLLGRGSFCSYLFCQLCPINYFQVNFHVSDSSIPISRSVLWKEIFDHSRKFMISEISRNTTLCRKKLNRVK